MELQLLVILVVALLVFGPEKMLEFATQMGRFVRKIRQEWAQIQMELEMQELKKKLEMDTKEGEEKVKKYLFGEIPSKPVSQKEFLKEKNPTTEEKQKPTPGENPNIETEQKEKKPSSLSMEDLVAGNAPVVEDLNSPKNTPGKTDNGEPKGVGKN